MQLKYSILSDAYTPFWKSEEDSETITLRHNMTLCKFCT